ncbi:DUF3558 domain-containing protein [Nocardia lasii]|uniref:DUF3558 domain-containing protein n=1 Tax=Nocardia lasii TaxID=1616107 RepID=A0ABW1JWB5_9NOCA
MNSKRSVGIAVPLSVVMAVLPGCSSNTPDSTESASAPAVALSESPARPTLTNPAFQPPSQDNEYTRSSGRPKVVYDPCTWLSDDDVIAAGYPAQSRKRGADLVAEYSFLNCRFQTDAVSLSVMSGNVTWDEDQQKNGTWLQPTTVNRRQAAMGREPETIRTGVKDCEVHMRTAVGVVFVSTRLKIQGEAQDLDPCADIMGVASIVEESIGEGN